MCRCSLIVRIITLYFHTFIELYLYLYVLNKVEFIIIIIIISI